MKRRALALGLLLAASGSACAPESPAAAYARDPEAVRRGMLIFRGTCGGYCHGLQPGARDAPYLFDCHWKNGARDEDLFRVISEGVPDTRMIGFGGTLPEGEADIWKVIAYLRTDSRCEPRDASPR